MCVVKIANEKEKLTAAWVLTVMLAWWDQTSSESDFKMQDSTQIWRLQ